MTITGVINPELEPVLMNTNTATITITTTEEEPGNNRSQAVTRVGIPHKIHLPVVVRGLSQ